MKLSMRSMIVAAPGNVLVAADLSQAESWVVAYLADEPNMKKSLHDGDIHTETAGSALFHPDVGCQHNWHTEDKELWTCLNGCEHTVVKTGRYIGKRYNHASAYRMSYIRAAEVINKDSDKPPYVTVTLEESKTFSTRWHQFYNIKNWWNEIEQQLSRERAITTSYGRKRIFFAQWGESLFKEATAYEPQSTVADHFNGMVHPQVGVKGGLLEIYRQLVKPYPEHKIINQSHDSAILEVPVTVGHEIVERMQVLLRRPIVIHGEEFTIPTDGEIGERWGEMENV